MIEFTKPDISKLNKKGYVCVDMHYHTVYSDGASRPNQLLEKIRKLKVGISITDHNEIQGSLELFKIKSDNDFVVPGIEVRSKELIDILFYFYDIKDLKKFFEKEILPFRKRGLHFYRTSISLSKLYELSRKYACLTSVAHPFGYTMRTGSTNLFEQHIDILTKFDVFEAINGGNSRKKNEEALSFIEKEKKCFTGGTDGHSIFPLGNIVACSKANTVREFLDNIKNKKNSVVGMETKFGKFGEYGNYAVNKLINLVR